MGEVIHYLSPGVSSIRCDENADISTDQLGSNHAWTQINKEQHYTECNAIYFKHAIVCGLNSVVNVSSTEVTWNRCAEKDFISLF